MTAVTSEARRRVHDFDEMVDRRGTGSMKWDVAAGELPMWVADMDFRTAPEIVDAIVARAATGVLGYSDVTDEYRAAVSGWWSRRHGWSIDPEWITLTTGTVPAVSSMVRSLTEPGDSVVLMTPVYNVFFASARNSGRAIDASQLVREGDSYAVDFADLERRLAEPRSTLLILCNPQNPTGTVWGAETLARIGDLCARHGVTVISDEVHCDLTIGDASHTPFASVSVACAAVSATCIAPTKAFNLAGLQTASVVTPNPELRARIVAGFNRDEVAEPNAFAVDATIAAFTHGEPWLDQLRDYLAANRAHAAAAISAIPGLRAEPGLATYLLWIDASDLGVPSGELVAQVRESTGLVLSDGASYDPADSTHVRMNLACPRERLDDGLTRLRRAVHLLMSTDTSTPPITEGASA